MTHAKAIGMDKQDAERNSRWGLGLERYQQRFQPIMMRIKRALQEANDSGMGKTRSSEASHSQSTRSRLSEFTSSTCNTTPSWQANVYDPEGAVRSQGRLKAVLGFLQVHTFEAAEMARKYMKNRRQIAMPVLLHLTIKTLSTWDERLQVMLHVFTATALSVSTNQRRHPGANSPASKATHRLASSLHNATPKRQGGLQKALSIFVKVCPPKKGYIPAIAFLLMLLKLLLFSERKA